MSAVLGGSQALWFVSRASGLALLAAFSAAVVLGVASRLGPRLAAGELHRALALFSVAFLGLHVATSLVRRRLGYRAWRAVHWLAYLAWPAAFAHAVTAGNDLRIWWVAVVVWGCLAAVATAVLARLLSWLRRPGPPGLSDQAVPAERALR